MKKIVLLALAAVCLTGCWTSISTVAPTVEPVVPVRTVYSTTVTTPTPKHTTVTTVTVTSFNGDMCFYLDLNAVAAAFAESRSVREFEQLLNSSRYMINNLDLNRDGWIDYLRVIETRNGYYHALLIQSCLAHGVFQDVATLVAERRSDMLYVEVIGDPYLYGYNYIVRPVFIKRSPMWNTYGQSSYTVWSSPYYWGYYPSYYTQPKPIYLNHYQAYVNTYMTNHHYCHHCDYPSAPNYSGYTTMTQPHHRNDYQTSHPEMSFENRVTRTIGTSSTGGVSVRNAGQLRTEVNKEAAKKETTETKPATATTTTTTSGRTSQTSATSTSTKTSTTSASTTSTTSGRTSTTSATSTSTKTGTSTRTVQPSTTMESRVNKSGTTRTTIKTTDSTGRTTSVKRETTNTSTRSTQSTSTRSTNSSTRSTNNSTRSTNQGTSTRSSQGTLKESNPRSSQPSR